MIDEEKLRRISSIRDECERLKSELIQIKRPSVNDITAIKTIYRALSSIELRKDAKLFIMLYLCSPSALSGEKIQKGIRSLLASLFGYLTPNAISVRSRNIYFYYSTYQDSSFGFRL